MKLDIWFTERPLEKLDCDAVVLLGFSDAWKEDGAVSSLDAGVSGYLMRMRAEGFWKGDEGETLLVSVPDKIPAAKILLKGLGAVANHTLERLGKRAEEVGDTLERMSVRRFGIRIPPGQGMNVEYARQLEIACRQLLKPFMARHRDEPELALKVYVFVDSTDLYGLSSTIRLLETHFRPLLRCAVGAEERLGPALAEG